MSSWLFPAVSASISAAFAVLVLMRYLKTGKRHQLLWTLGLFGFAAAALAQVVTDLNNGWSEGVYRFYYFLIGSLVITLGAGTVYLMNKPKVADLFLYAVIGLVATQAVVCAVTTIDTAGLAAAGTETGVKIASVPMRILTAVMSFTGAGALIAGAAISWWSTKRPHNLAIVAGSIALSVGGSAAGGLAGVPTDASGAALALYVGNLVGIALLFIGFLMARPVADAKPTVPAAPAETPSA